MSKYSKVSLIAFIAIALGVIGYYTFLKEVDKEDDNQTFYAIIESINNNSILVEGIEENDINYRTKYSFSIKDTTILEWRNTKIQLSDLQVGDRISIIFNGPVLDSYPGQLTNVIKIQLLNDRLDENHIAFEIIDETDACDSALELFYEDYNYKYYFNCIRSESTYIKFNDGRKYTIKEAVNQNMVSIADIEQKIKGTISENIISKIAK